MGKEYLIQEKPLKALIVFVIPMIIGNLFQQFYTMVDSVVVGRFVSEQALAAVGASYSLTTVFISSFISTWNTYLWPMLVTNNPLMRTVQVGVTMLNNEDGNVYGPIMAASMMVLVPTAMIFLIFRKKIVSGMMGGAIKG